MQSIFVIFFCITIFLYHSTVQASLFVGLGDLSGGYGTSMAKAVSADGSTVAGNFYGGFGGEAFIWTQDNGMVGLGLLNNQGYTSEAYGLSADGSVAVGPSYANSFPGGVEAFRWTKEDQMIGLGGYGSRAYAISANGSVIVGKSYPASGDSEAFRWTHNDGLVLLGKLPFGDFSIAYSASSDGSIVVGVGSTMYLEGGLWRKDKNAFIWTQADGMVSLGGKNSFAYDISDNGLVIVGESIFQNGNEAFLWTQNSGMIGLGDLPGGVYWSKAYGVSGDGSIVVGSSDTGYGYSQMEAFIWDAVNGIQNLKNVLSDNYNLDLTGWHLDCAESISADGKVAVGWGRNPDGVTEAWIAIMNYKPAGDFDLDTDVEGTDLYKFIIAFSNNVYPDADLNSDGDIDSEDVRKIAQEFGKIFPEDF